MFNNLLEKLRFIDQDTQYINIAGLLLDYEYCFLYTCWYSSMYRVACRSKEYSLMAIAKRCCKQFARQFSLIFSP